MKRYINILAFSALLFAGCSKDAYECSDDVVDVSWYTNETGYQTTDPILLCEGGYLTLMDSSQGYKSHEWRIGDADSFMVNKFDYLSTPIVNQVDPSKGKVSKNSVETVYFGEVKDEEQSRLATVTLYNVFPQKVTSHDSKNPVEAVQNEQGDWVLEKKFNVQVYDNLKPAYTIFNQAGVEVFKFGADDEVPESKDDWTEVEIGMGEIMTIVDNTDYMGLAGVRTVAMAGSDEGSMTAEKGMLTFSNKGEYSEHLITTNRVMPLGAVSRNIPLKIKVVHSELQLSVYTMTVDYSISNHSLIAKFNGAVSSIPADFAAGVTAKVVSGGVNLGYEVEEVKMVEGSTSLVEFVFKSTDGSDCVLIGGDEITLSFPANENIKSSDGRTLIAFDNATQPVIVPEQSILSEELTDFFGFEGDKLFGGDGWYILPAQNYDQFKKGGIMHSTDLVLAGERSCLIDFSQAVPAETGSFIFITSNPTGPTSFNLTAGEYKLKYSVFLNAPNGVDGGTYKAIIHNTGTNVWADEEVEFSKAGSWQEVSLDMIFTEDLVNGQLKFEFPLANVSDDFKMYIDKVELVAVRPQYD